MSIGIGSTFERLTVRRCLGRHNHDTLWQCECVCGNTCQVTSGNLRAGRNKSCGCLRKELGQVKNLKHGKRYSAVYPIWNGMLQRCHNPNNKQYSDYGARGITVCEPWHRFENFYADMGDPPKGGMLERADNDKGYCKENCRWATRTEQNRNKRNNFWITHNGETMLLPDWAKRYGLNPRTLASRIYLYHWPIKEALETPVKGKP